MFKKMLRKMLLVFSVTKTITFIKLLLFLHWAAKGLSKNVPCFSNVFKLCFSQFLFRGKAKQYIPVVMDLKISNLEKMHFI